MSTSPPFLPPVQAAQSAKAAVQAVAVKLIQLPASLKNNSSPVTVRGEVSGQSAQGNVLVETERGIVELVLRDRGSLPKGARIEIEIPAGRTPQQAHIRPDSAPNSRQANEQTKESSSAPPQLSRLAETLSQEGGRLAARLDRNAPIDPRTMENVLNSRSSALADTQGAIPIAKGNLEIGQYVRLTPIPPAALEETVLGGVQNLRAALPSLDIVSGLVGVYGALSSSHQDENTLALRGSIAGLLSQIDVPTLLAGVAKDVSLPLIQNINKILQGSGLTNQFIQGFLSNDAAKLTQAVARFNPTMAVDAQILASHFLSPSPSAASLAGGRPPSPLSFSGDVLASSFLPKASSSVAAQSGTAALPSALQSGALPLQIPSLNSLPLSSEGGELKTQFFISHTPSQIQNAPQNGAGFTSIAQVVGQTSQNLPVLAMFSPGTGATQHYVMQFHAQNLLVSGETGIDADQELPRLFLALRTDLTDQMSAPKNPVWGQLQDLLDYLKMQQLQSGSAAASGTQAAAAFSNMLPSPAHPANLGALASLFLSVFRGGDLESFMPATALDLLRQTSRGRSLMDTITGELTRLGRQEMAVSVGGDWRGVYLPFVADQNIYKVPLYYKDMSDEQSEEDIRKKRRLRFLFDLNLSRMGDVQIDGFLQGSDVSSDKNTRLDLVMRTRTPLSSPMQTRMKQLYAGAVERSRLTGELSFQFKADQWVDFGEELELSSLNA